VADGPGSRPIATVHDIASAPADVGPLATAPVSASVDRPGDPPFTFSAAHGGGHDEYRPDLDGDGDERSSAWWKNWRVIGAALAVVAVIGVGSSIGARRPAAEPEVHAASGTLEVSTNPAGVQAFIDGELRGVTPLVLALEPGSHALELRGAGEPRTIPITVNPGARVSQYVELSSSPAASRPPSDGRPAESAAAAATSNAAASTPTPAVAPPSAVVNGTVTVASPVELQVFENGTLLGSARDRLALAPGRHDLDLVNAELGVRSTQTVQVSANRTATLTAVLPNGTLSLNAVPWAEVWLDGEKVGETPMGNVSVRVGSHDVVFRHPDLGERHQTVIVSAKEPARLSVTMQGR
jgi:serine/threonine-protein kinase